VSGFAIGGGGALTAQGSTGPISGTTTSSQPFGAAVSPNGQDLYVANFALGSVSTYSIGPGGALTAQGPPAISGVNSSSGAYELAVSPDQGPVAAYAAMLSPTTATGTFSAQPSVAGSTPIGTYAWQFGDGTRASGPLVTHTFPARGTYAVTLTLTGTDSCSVSGPFTGQSAMCTSDPPATFTHAITMPAPPVASREAISGVAKGKPKLAFTVAAGTLAPSLATITVNLPTGLTWSTRKTNLARHIAVTGANGKAAKFTATVHRRALTLALASVQPSARVTITNPELWASKSLVKQVDPPRKSGKRGKKVKRPKPVRLTFKLKLTDAAHDAINLVLKATAA
jgi:DNA-binding beta-propeller fold protein YncE